MTAVTMLLSTLWTLRTIRSAARETAFWQTKEYRWDRVRAHLALPSSRVALFHPLGLLKWLLFVILVIQPARADVVSGTLLALYMLECVFFGRELLTRTAKRPQWTAKALTVLGGALIVVFAIVPFTARFMGDGEGVPLAATLLLGDRLVLFLVPFVVALLAPVSTILKQRIIARARILRQSFHGLSVVGITGSYGKTSTKEFLAQLLPVSPDTVLTTPANTNTEIGVAQVILAKLRPTHEVFICEMGAYREGEIRRVAEIARPKIGILTAIATQHLALFGSLEAIRRAKSELIASLPHDGTAIVNDDDPLCAEIARNTQHCRALTYGKSERADVRASDLQADLNGISASVRTPWGSAAIHVPFLGRHFLQNALAALTAAAVMGHPLPTLVERLSSLHLPERRLAPARLRDGTVLLDDSYNANPDGVLAALDTLAMFRQKKKVVVLTPMIELGPFTRDAHARVGKALATVATNVLLTQWDFADVVRAGMESGAVSAPALVVVPSSAKIVAALRSLRGDDCVVLLVGRLPARAWEILIRDGA